MRYNIGKFQASPICATKNTRSHQTELRAHLLHGGILTMSAITAGDFRNGLTFEMEGKVYQVVEFQHVKISLTLSYRDSVLTQVKSLTVYHVGDLFAAHPSV